MHSGESGITEEIVDDESTYLLTEYIITTYSMQSGRHVYPHEDKAHLRNEKEQAGLTMTNRDRNNTNNSSHNSIVLLRQA